MRVDTRALLRFPRKSLARTHSRTHASGEKKREGGRGIRVTDRYG